MPKYRPGDHEYRAFVGPFDQYDMMGATQFALLYALGIRHTHRLLDIGCGSLRAGRFFIIYLDHANYVGIEPNTWLIDEAIEKQIGRDLVKIKGPVFSDSSDFDVSGLGTFDFVVAQSIGSHTGPALVSKLLRAVKAALAPRGLGLVTFIHGGDGDPQVVQVNRNDAQWPDWLYPRCFSYRAEVVDAYVRESGLVGSRLRWYHPRQTWWILAHGLDALPEQAVLDQMTGLTLASGFEGSREGVSPVGRPQSVKRGDRGAVGLFAPARRRFGAKGSAPPRS